MSRCTTAPAGTDLLPGEAVDAGWAKNEPGPERWHAVYLSPHFDDAVLSCGASIRRRTQAGQRVLVVTVCAGAPPTGDALSPFARALHARWSEGLGGADLTAEGAVALRRAEDARAVALLGAAACWLDFPDAVYRRDRRQQWPYDCDSTLFGRLAPSDRPLVQRLAARLGDIAGIAGGTPVFVPLAVGGHVDHRLVRSAAGRWLGGTRPWHYEDYPYAADPEALRAALTPAGAWVPRATAVTEHHVQAKIAAAACYGSQLSTFWAGRDHMERRIREFAASRGSRGMVERCWRRAPERRPAPSAMHQ